jgi:alkylation response protein AidB-like acyl-CoA dehydrogenase
VIRHKLVDMALKIDAARSLVYELAYRIQHRLADPQQLVARIAMAKVLSTQAMQHCADQAVQILGGMGFMRGTKQRTPLPGGEGDDDRRWIGRDHEGSGRARNARSCQQCCSPAQTAASTAWLGAPSLVARV